MGSCQVKCLTSVSFTMSDTLVFYFFDFPLTGKSKIGKFQYTCTACRLVNRLKMGKKCIRKKQPKANSRKYSVYFCKALFCKRVR